MPFREKSPESSLEFRETGRQGENLFPQVMKGLGVEVVEYEKVGKKLPQNFALAKATEEEDRRGWDFWLWSKPHDRWLTVDLTTNPDSENLRNKDQRKRADLVILIPFRILERAAGGSREALDQVNTIVDEELKTIPKKR